jgi:endonuclease/exonuclease/phosphatase family metal-dependent hydrolase
VKILQLNIWGGRIGKRVVDLLKHEQADVVCLQEAIEVVGGDSFLFEDIEEIKSTSGYAHSFFTPQLGYNLMKRHAKSGMAILSAHPFETTTAVYTRLAYTDNFDLLDTDYNVRGLQHVTVGTPTGVVHVLNHHGHHVRNHKHGDEETVRQCKEIADYIEKLNGPVVLCGDFNLSPTSESLKPITKLLVDLTTVHNITTTRTELTHKTEVCDYIFTSPDIVVTNFQVLDDIVSDHKALTVSF